MQIIFSLIKAIWAVTGAMAPYLFFGFLIAGLLSVFVSPELVERHLGKRGFWQVCKASLLGVPIPLCSCSVIPVAVSLRRHGASKGATLSFLASTPQTGVDSIMVTYGMLGPVFAIFRIITAFVSGILGGALLEAMDGNGEQANDGKPEEACRCCHDKGKRHPLVRALRYGFLDLPHEIGKAVLLGVVLSGILTVIVPENYFAGLFGSGFLSILVAMVVGIPLYVCSTGSVPIAMAFLSMGLSPGAALAFLVTGPATNAATITTLWKTLGARAVVVYLVSIAGSAVGAALLLNRIAGDMVRAQAPHAHDMTAGWPTHVLAAALLGLLAWAILRPSTSSDDSKTQSDGSPVA